MNVRKMKAYNFYCVCGDLQFMEVWEETLPIFFTEENQSRKAYSNEYFFLGTKISEIDGEVWLHTEFVKKENFTNIQVYNKRKKIIEYKKRNLESVSSSYLAIRLKDNKMIWLEKDSNSPSINEFRATYRFLLKANMTEYVREIKDEEGESLTSLRKKYVEGSHVEVLGFPAKNNLESQIDSFETLTEVSIETTEVNTSSDIKNVTNHLGATKLNVGAESVSTTFVSRAGLSKEKVLELFTEVSPSSILSWKLLGEGDHGIKIKASSHVTRSTSPIVLRGTVSEIVSEMVSKFAKLESTGLIPSGTECSSINLEDAYEKYKAV